MNLGGVPRHPNEKHKIKLTDGIPKPPILGLFVGKRGQGKSTAAVRLLRYYIDYNPPVFQKEFIFVISPTAESQPHLWEFCRCLDENVHTATTSDEIRKLIFDVFIPKLSEAKERYDLDQEYLEAYSKLMHNQLLTDRQCELLEQRNCEPLTDPAPWPRPILLLDDLSHMKVLDKPWFVSLCLRHRHVANGVSLSMFILCQSLHGGLSRVVRQNCSLICLFATHDKTCIEDLYKECSHLLERDEFEAIFESATEDFHSFLSVDLSQHDPNQVFSRDFQKWYNIRVPKIMNTQDNLHQNNAQSSQPPERLLSRQREYRKRDAGHKVPRRRWSDCW